MCRLWLKNCVYKCHNNLVYDLPAIFAHRSTQFRRRPFNWLAFEDGPIVAVLTESCTFRISGPCSSSVATEARDFLPRCSTEAVNFAWQTPAERMLSRNDWYIIVLDQDIPHFNRMTHRRAECGYVHLVSCRNMRILRLFSSC